MPQHNAKDPTTFKLSLESGDADFDSLVTDDDFRREAKRLLPAAVEQFAVQMGEHAYTFATGKLHEIPGVNVDTTDVTRRLFAANASQNYRTNVSEEDKRKIEDNIFENLKRLKREKSS